MTTEIGVVYYRIKPNTDELEATWYASHLQQKKTGSGIAKGDTSNGYPGAYTVTYFSPDGNKPVIFVLNIKKSGSIYELSWSKEEHVLFVGVGIETSDGLVAGWRPVDINS
ncbi:MAG: hypothetical protein FH748_03030 [Balneolaceae bacterium]|nr:hypothetical protein [Balneolaceae bacterium]